jgi:hypothetical protein
MTPELIETIEKALEDITQGKWVNCSWDPMERPHVFAKEKQTGQYCNGRADLPLTPEDANFIANTPEWLRALLEERSTHAPHGRNYTNEQYVNLRLQLEQVKAERDKLKSEYAGYIPCDNKIFFDPENIQKSVDFKRRSWEGEVNP